jgi:hypothetical protein
LAFGLGLDRGAGVLGKQGYRYAFNGKEVDDEGEWGTGTTAYDYGFETVAKSVSQSSTLTFVNTPIHHGKHRI